MKRNLIKLLLSGLLFINLVCFENIIAQENASIVSANFSTFATNADLLGSVGNSVNLYSGDVNLPLNLISIPGRNGLGVNVSVLYNSNVHQIVDNWNLEAPTGILGLGWSMDYEKIVVDHKNTGTRYDDDFYLVAGGTSNKLVRVGSASDNPYQYETQNYQFWKIYFYPNEEKWEIIKEDGSTFEYGDKNSTRNTVQWGVKWVNWIGVSSEIKDYLNNDHQQFALIWNMSKVSNIWGEQITYKYLEVKNQVGTGGQYHTEASYLQEIKDVFGQKVLFTYDEKFYDQNTGPAGEIEFMEPHTEVTYSATLKAHEPDAYQERYERKFLDYIEVFTKDDEKLLSVEFGYDFMDSNNQAKRRLVSITQKNVDGVALPDISFDYISSGTNIGALQNITFPQGGSATYVYQATTPDHSYRQSQGFTIAAPETYFSEPKVFVARDYVVVTWYDYDASPTTDKISIQLFQWDGEWFQVDLDPVAPSKKDFRVSTRNDQDNDYHSQNFSIVVEESFFALITNPFSYGSSDYKELYIHRKNPFKRNEWIWDYDIEFLPLDNLLSLGNDGAKMISGRNFIAVLGPEHGKMYRIRFNGQAWEGEFYYSTDRSSNSDDEFDMAGTGNYFIEHNPQGTDVITLHYLNEVNEWQTAPIPPIFTLNANNNELSPLYSSESYAIIVGRGTNEYIYRWDENFTNFKRDDVLGSVDHTYKVFVSNVLLAIPSAGKSRRWTGKEWKGLDYSVGANEYHALGNDLLIRRYYVTGGWLYRYDFNPNTLAWPASPVTETSFDDPLFSIFGDNYTQYSSAETAKTKVFVRMSDGTYTPTNISFTSNSNWLLLGDHFYAYNYDSFFPDLELRVSYLKNNTWSSPIALSQENVARSTVGGKNLVAFNHNYLSGASQLTLYRNVSEGITGQQEDYPVETITINDGFNNYNYTSFEYNEATATYDPSGTIAQYNEVTVYPGTNNPASSRPYGYTKNYFLNGLSNAELDKDFPGNDSYTNAEDHYNLLKGSAYLTEVYNSISVLLATTTNYFKVFSKILGSKDIGTYVRLMKTESTRESITSTSTTEYNNYGFPNKVETANTDASKRIATTQYACELTAYSGMLSENMLSQAVQQTLYEGSVGSGNARTSSATTYKEWVASSGKWTPVSTYSWLDKDGSNSYTDFATTNWQYNTAPSTEWIKASTLLDLDATNGNILEVEDINSIVTSTKWGYDDKLPIATFTNSGSEECFYDGFESGDFTGQNVIWGGHGSGTREVIDEDAHSGNYSMKFTKVDAAWTGIYMSSPYIDVTPGEAHTISLWYKCDPGRQASINWYDQTNYKSHGFNKEGTGDWEYLEYTFTAPTADPLPCTKLRVYLYGHSGTPNTPIYYDDVRVNPGNAITTSTTSYDPKTLQITSTSDENDYTSYIAYDQFNRASRALDDEKYMLSEQRYYSSLEENPSFSTTDPNSVTSVTYPDGVATNGLVGFWQFEGDAVDATENHNDGTVSGADTALGFIGRCLTFDGNDQISIPNDATLQLGKSMTIEFRIKSGGGHSDWVRIIGKGNTTYRNYGLWVATNGNILFQIYSASGVKSLLTSGINIYDDKWHHIVGTYDGSYMRIYLDGVEKVSTSYSNTPYTSTDPLTIGYAGIHTYLKGEVDEVRVYNTVLTAEEILSATNLLVTTTYMDGLGREIQSQSRNGDNDIVNHSIYDSKIGKPHKTYQPFEVDTGHKYLPFSSFPVGLDYGEQLYKDEPMARLDKSIAMGNSSSQFVKYTYSTGTINSKTYHTVEVMDELNQTGTASKSYTDIFGNTIKSTDALSSTTDEISATYTYDILGNVLTTADPKGFISTNTYDTFSRVLTSDTPDENTTNIRYDDTGNLRFSQTAEQAANDEFMVFYYDELGRVEHEGIERDYTTAWSSTFPDVSNTTYGKDANEWRTKSYYGSDFVNAGENFVHGRLTKTETNDDADDDVEHSTRYVYDREGNIIAKYVLIDGGQNLSEKIIQHQYDKLGREIIQVYPSGLTISNSYDETGRLKSVSVIE